MLLDSDLSTPRRAPRWRPTWLLFGVLGLATVGPAMIDRRASKLNMGKHHL